MTAFFVTIYGKPVATFRTAVLARKFVEMMDAGMFGFGYEERNIPSNFWEDLK